ncbi:MAG: (d)CMP kinase [Dehalococcoidia bacterium]
MDGPAASGKSAVGTRVAERLGLPFVDTGAMYRAITWLALRRGVPLDDPAALTALAATADVAIRPPAAGSAEYATVLMDGMDATPYLRAADVERAVSLVSAVPGVRERMVAIQRQAAGAAIVMAGRDIGTVVLPHAEVKVYLEASPEVRARRRQAEMAAKGRVAAFEDVLADLRRRDGIDSGRDVAPLRPADDAVVIPTDALSIDQVVERVLALVRRTDAGAAGVGENAWNRGSE